MSEFGWQKAIPETGSGDPKWWPDFKLYLMVVGIAAHIAVIGYVLKKLWP